MSTLTSMINYDFKNWFSQISCNEHAILTGLFFNFKKEFRGRIKSL